MRSSLALAQPPRRRSMQQACNPYVVARTLLSAITHNHTQVRHITGQPTPSTSIMEPRSRDCPTLSNMPIHICPATTDLAPRLASIHVSAFSSNRLMRNIYPTAAIWAAFERAVEEKVIADMLDERTSVVVAQWSEENEDQRHEKSGDSDAANRHGGEIAGFAVWCHPSPKEHEETGTYTAPRWNLPPGTDWGTLNSWRDAAARVADDVIGDDQHYELSWIAVSPIYARQGVGKMLLRWGLDRCDKQGIPAYLESTVEAAETFYKKAGFREKGRIQLMVKGELYEEVACLYEPETRSRGDRDDLALD